MSKMKEYAPGTFCWAELMADDANGAKEFYSKLFGWSFTDVPIGDGMVYSMAAIGGKDTGGIYQMWAQQKEQGVPTHWGSYVSVSNVEESAKKAREAGGTVIVEPMDVFDAGKMASLIDPTGAVISLWQPMKHMGTRVVNEHGAFCWNELVTNDTGKAGVFYKALFGWSADEQDFGTTTYTIFMHGEKAAGGMMKIDENWMPPSWIVYITVNDCDSCVNEVRSLGGNISAGPMDIPGVGRIAYMADPRGAAFAVIQPKQM